MRYFSHTINPRNSPPDVRQMDTTLLLKRALILLLCCTVTLIVPAIAQPTAGTFYAQQVDPGSGYDAAYEAMSLALDDSGNPHIGYWAFNGSGQSYIMHGWKDGSGWQYEPVNVTTASYPYPSIAVDNSGNPHLCFRNSSSFELNYAWKDVSGWDISPVPGVLSASYISLALDDDDAPHVVYYDSANWKLNYTFWNGTAWKTETVASFSNQMYPSIALDSDGYPHISWMNRWSPYQVKYAWKDGSGWHTETVNVTGDNSRYTSLALDPVTGYPSIAYSDVEGFGVDDSKRAMYAWKDGSGWHVEPVADDDYLESVSLGLTDSGAPRLAYVAPDDTLQLAYRNATGWHSIEVDDCSGRGPSLAMDPWGYPAISYGKIQNELWYAYYAPVEPDFTADATWGEVPLTVTFTDTTLGDPVAWFWDFGDGSTATEQNFVHTYTGVGTYTVTLKASDELGTETVSKTGYITVVPPTITPGWNITIVDSVGIEALGVGTSLVLDDSDTPFISYHDSINYTLKYAVWDGVGWSIETVDAGEIPSLALDASGYPHIVYTSTNALKYAVWNGSAWSIETVESGIIPLYTSFALDTSDTPHISYFDGTNFALKYAVWTGSGWSNETVDSAGQVGGSTSLALDSSDHPHISYDTLNGDLKYAVWTGSAWSIATVDTGAFPSLALDGSSNPHISYFSNGNLKYAVWNGSAWSIETVETGIIPYHTSLVLDGLDYPHISYFDLSNHPDTGDIKYAVRTGSTWSIMTVDTLRVDWFHNDIIFFPSLALDTMRYPHISYCDISNGDLKYGVLGPVPFSAFSADPPSGTAPLTVTFTDQSTGSPTQWLWLFGDGGTSTGQHPNHLYTAPGTYSVTLTATNRFGSDTAVMEDYITVLAPPTTAAPRRSGGGSSSYTPPFEGTETPTPTTGAPEGTPTTPTLEPSPTGTDVPGTTGVPTPTGTTPTPPSGEFPTTLVIGIVVLILIIGGAYYYLRK